ncbi:MAG: FAD:protein FMN transferase [Mycobacterium leprae]
MGNAPVRRRWLKSALHMDTVVNMTVLSSRPESEVMAQLERAFHAFTTVERVCSRFDPESELSQLSRQVGVPVPVSPLLFQAIHFARWVAESTGGAFDPTVGRWLEGYGFNRNYLSRELAESAVDPTQPVSYQDLLLDETERSVLVARPLLIDLGAVAKGLAVDLAARELAFAEGFVIDAGGDIYAGGLNEQDEPWRIGIQHPLRPDETVLTLHLTDTAVCTSGSYERPSPVKGGAHHLIDPRSGRSQTGLVSCTVIAPFAMMADAVSTAAFVLGSEAGAAYLDDLELAGLLIEPSMALHYTKTMMRYLP